MVRTSRLFLLVALVAVLFLAMAATVQAADTTQKGTIKTVNADKNEFVMADTTNKNWTFHCDKACKVTINGKESKLSSLQAGEMAEVTYNKDGDRLLATKVVVTQK